MNRLIIFMLALAFLALACGGTVPTTTEPAPTIEETATAVISTPIATWVIPSATLQPSPTPTNKSLPDFDLSDNRLKNPGFEGYTTQRVYPEINVFVEWEPVYCDGCPAYRQGDGNPEDLLMGRPEYKPAFSDLHPERIRSGHAAQQWFCFYRTCEAGVEQEIDTIPGEICLAGAWVMSWSTATPGKLESDDHNQDALDNSLWTIYTGDHSESFDYSAGFYDQYAHISTTFIATAEKTLISFIDRRLWPVIHNDSYIDDAYVYCYLPEQPAPTNTPTPTSTATAVIPPLNPTPTQIATFPPGYELTPQGPIGILVADKNMVNVRECDAEHDPYTTPSPGVNPYLVCPVVDKMDYESVVPFYRVAAFMYENLHCYSWPCNFWHFDVWADVGDGWVAVCWRDVYYNQHTLSSLYYGASIDDYWNGNLDDPLDCSLYPRG